MIIRDRMSYNQSSRNFQRFSSLLFFPTFNEGRRFHERESFVLERISFTPFMIIRDWNENALFETERKENKYFLVRIASRDENFENNFFYFIRSKCTILDNYSRRVIKYK